MLHSTVLFCSERELTNKTVPSSPSSDTKVVNLLELQRLHHKLSAEALTNKLDRSKGLLVWLGYQQIFVRCSRLYGQVLKFLLVPYISSTLMKIASLVSDFQRPLTIFTFNTHDARK